MSESAVDSSVEAKLLAVVNEIALKYATTLQWSDWHTYKVVSALQSKNSAEQLAEYEKIWEKPQRYGTCVDFAHVVCRDLKARLLEIPGLGKFAEKVKYMVGFCKQYDDDEEETDSLEDAEIESSKRGAEDEDKPFDSPNHVITAIFLQSSVIVVDLAFHPAAFALPLEQEYRMCCSIDMHGVETEHIYCYSSEKSDDGEPELMRLCQSSEQDRANIVDKFKEMSYSYAVQEMSINWARLMCPWDDGSGISNTPPRKYILIRRLIRSPPEELPYYETSSGYITITCKLSVDFVNMSLALQIPTTDWLYKPKNARFRRALRTLKVKTQAESTANVLIILDLAKPEKLDVRVELFGAIGDSLGLPRSDFVKAMQSIYDVEYNVH